MVVTIYITLISFNQSLIINRFSLSIFIPFFFSLWKSFDTYMSLWFCFSDLCLEWLPAIALVGFCWKNCCASKLQWVSLNSFDWDWDFFSLVTIWIYIMSFDIWSISKRMKINLKLNGGNYRSIFFLLLFFYIYI